jgi:dephospho-CoA kinase
MTEIVFLVGDDPDGGYTARALGEPIFTQADDLKTLREMVRDAVHCHFLEDQNRPKIIRLHIVRDEVIASCS